MELLYLGFVFLTIVVLLAFRRPLYQAIFGSLVVTILLWRIPPAAWLSQTIAVFTNWNSLSVLASLYLITYLQRMLEVRKQIQMAQQDLNGLFYNRRTSTLWAAIFIGLLPSVAATLLCGDVVKRASDGYLQPKEQAFVTSWIRHIPESTLPTYAGVLLMANISGLPLSGFMLSMIVPMVMLGLLGYFPYLHRLPKNPETPRSNNRLQDALHLFQHLWTLLAILLLILIAGLSVVPAVVVVIVAAALVYRFRVQDLLPMLRSAFEGKMLLNTFLVLVLKEFISYTGVLEKLPATFSALPIPAYLIFAMLFFVGGIISGSNGIIAMGAPLAFAAIPGGIPLMMLLMCMCHAAMQISPTHVCLAVASDYFHITLGELIRKTLPAVLIFCTLMVVYYRILLLF